MTKQQLNLQLKNEFGQPLNLRGIDRLILKLQREDGLVLEKTNYKVDSLEEAKLHFDLSEFDIQSLVPSEKQTFFIEIIKGNEKSICEFENCLDVFVQNGKKMLK